MNIATKQKLLKERQKSIRKWICEELTKFRIVFCEKETFLLVSCKQQKKKHILKKLQA